MANPGNLPAGADLTDFEMGLNVNAGDQFMICFSNFSSASTNVPLNFFGTATVSCGNAFGATICYGDTATIYATSGISYTWDTSIPGFIGTNSTGDTAYVNPTITTNYLVTIDFGPTGTQLDTALVEVLPALNSTVIITYNPEKYEDAYSPFMGVPDDPLGFVGWFLMCCGGLFCIPIIIVGIVLSWAQRATGMSGGYGRNRWGPFGGFGNNRHRSNRGNRGATRRSGGTSRSGGGGRSGSGSRSGGGRSGGGGRRR